MIFWVFFCSVFGYFEKSFPEHYVQFRWWTYALISLIYIEMKFLGHKVYYVYLALMDSANGFPK